jgi:hypothetical protein
MNREILPGMAIFFDAQGCWLDFQSDSGRAQISLSAYAADRSPIARRVIEEWIEKTRKDMAGGL